VLLVHGRGSSTREWDRQIPALAAHHTVIAVDLRGHGQSARTPGPYSIALFADDLVHVLETLGLGPVHVVGLSLGGMVAFQLALDARPLVRSLVIVNSGPSAVPTSVREWMLLQGRLWLLRLFGPRRFGAWIARLNFPAPEQAAERQALADRIGANHLPSYLAATRAILGWSVDDRIAAIDCPTLVLTGDRDYTPVARKQAYAIRMPAARVQVIAASGHCTPVDQPEAFNRAVLDFLGGVARPPSAA
jgi:pimeloyl-ACP methyl ester carboxylesterase